MLKKILILITTFVIMIHWNSAGQYSDMNYGVVPTSYIAPQNETELPGQKSKTKARALSFGATAVPVLSAFLINQDPYPSLIVGGMFAGPAAGIIYGDDWIRAGRGLLIRAASIGIVYLGAFPLGGFTIFDPPSLTGQVVMYSGAGIFGSSVLWDIFISSARSVEDYNDRLREKQGVSISPWFEPITHSSGIRISYNF